MKRNSIFDASIWMLALLSIAAPAKADDAAMPAGTPAVILEGSGDVSVGGQAAARKGDATDSAQPLAQGSKDVLINGKPAVTAGDVTACGGIAIGGASNVFINGKPVARSGDIATACPRR
jgi:uncharacterized Zn-binding protein involved in type VI secretion